MTSRLDASLASEIGCTLEEARARQSHLNRGYHDTYLAPIKKAFQQALVDCSDARRAWAARTHQATLAQENVAAKETLLSRATEAFNHAHSTQGKLAFLGGEL
jgi:hypothetical protein